MHPKMEALKNLILTNNLVQQPEGGSGKGSDIFIGLTLVAPPGTKVIESESSTDGSKK